MLVEEGALEECCTDKLLEYYHIERNWIDNRTCSTVECLTSKKSAGSRSKLWCRFFKSVADVCHACKWLDDPILKFHGDVQFKILCSGVIGAVVK